MKQMLKCETFMAIMITLIITDLVVAPFIGTVSLAQTLDLNSPVISHQPRTISYKSKSFNIIAHVGTREALSKVSIQITHSGKTITGAMPEKKESGIVPVIVTPKMDLTIYAGPATKYGKKGVAEKGETLFVTDVRGSFYRIRTGADIYGYVESAGTDKVLSGKAFGVAIPVSLTQGSSLSYKISATDIKGRIASTDVITVKFRTEDEIAALKEGKLPPTEHAAAAGSSKSSFSKAFPWIVLLGIGGIAAYFLTHKTKEDKEATVDVVVNWD